MSDSIEQTEQTVVKKSSIKTPVNVAAKKVKKNDRVPWQRMALSLGGISITAGMWRWATYHLYTLPEHTIVAFTSITNNAFYVIAAIVVFMVTGKLVYDWKNETTTSLIDQASHLTEHKQEDINKKEDIHQVVEYKVDENVPNANLREFQEY